jgi:hypothetical protein
MAVGVPSEDDQILAKVHATAERYVADYGAVRDFGRSDPDAGFMNPADAALIQIPGTGQARRAKPRVSTFSLSGVRRQYHVLPAVLIARSSSVEIRCELSAMGMRREKAALHRGARPTRRFAPAGSNGAGMEETSV